MSLQLTESYQPQIEEDGDVIYLIASKDTNHDGFDDQKKIKDFGFAQWLIHNDISDSPTIELLIQNISNHYTNYLFDLLKDTDGFFDMNEETISRLCLFTEYLVDSYLIGDTPESENRTLEEEIIILNIKEYKEALFETKDKDTFRKIKNIYFNRDKASLKMYSKGIIELEMIFSSGLDNELN